MKIKLGLENLSAHEVAEYCGGKLVGEFENKAEYVCTDSREADGKTLFIVTVGERVDGHNYIASAKDSGCRCFLCQYIPEGIDTSGCSFVLVDDSVAAFSSLARGYRSKKKMQNIAITGSVGKTTTKELVASVMREKYRVYSTDGNFNSVIGMPMSLMEAASDCELGVFEMGMSGFSEIRSMSACAEPSVAIVTNIGTSHLEYLKTRENICRAKLEIADGLVSGGYLLLNGDEPLLSVAPAIVGRNDINYIYVSLGENENADYRAENIRLFETYSIFDVVTPKKAERNIRVDIPGKHIVFNSVMAYAAADILGLSDDEIHRGLQNYTPVGNRQNIYDKNGVKIIADCYNAAPESMRAAISVLCAFSGGRKIAVLGDMLELGDDSDRLHLELGEYLFSRCDILFTYGASGELIAKGAISAGMPPESVFSYAKDAPLALAEKLNSVIRKNDIALFKASRGMKLENIIEKLNV